MSDIIFLAFITIVMFGAGFLGILLGRKMFMKITVKMPVYIYGLRKKNRGYLRDEHLMPAYWKMHNLIVLFLLDTAFMFGIISMENIRSNWLYVLYFSAIGTVVAIVLAIKWHKSWVNFIKLKDELGIEFENSKEFKKTVDENTKKEAFRVIKIVTIMIAVVSIMNFLLARVFWGIFLAVCAGVNMIIIIIDSVKKKHGNNKSN